MLDIELGASQTCDGATRRDFLRVGALSAFGLTLPSLLQAQDQSPVNRGKAKDVSVILLFMSGGPSQIDTFDPKPDAPTDYRGSFKAIGTNVAGMQLSEHLPLLAKQADKFSILRSVTSPDGNHETACHYVLTGYPFSPALEYPGYGSVLAKEKGGIGAIPPYAHIGGLPNNHGGAGYLGAVYNPFIVGGDPNDQNFSVRDVAAPYDVDAVRMSRRRGLRDALDRWQRDKEHAAKAALTTDAFYAKAFDLVTSPEAKKAFTLSDEPAKLREEYGRTQFGQSCLLARRLVENGVRCVAIHSGGWDTHENNFNTLKDNLLPPLDKGYAALLKDLKARGMLDTTLVVWMGEFGRTPRINGSAGRDHWSGAFSVCLGGGGIKTGQVVGSTNDRAEYPKERPIRVEDVASTIYHALGIDAEKEYLSPQARPIRINYGGIPLSELL